MVKLSAVIGLKKSNALWNSYCSYINYWHIQGREDIAIFSAHLVFIVYAVWPKSRSMLFPLRLATPNLGKPGVATFTYIIIRKV